MKIFHALESWNRTLSVWLAFVVIAAVGALDYVTVRALSLSLFYLLPVALLAWKGGRLLGLGGSLASALVWVLASIGAGELASPLVLSWDAVARFLIYAVLTLLISSLKDSIIHLETMSRTDPLTGAANSRAFREQLKGELERSRRYRRPFTISYLDLDNFKTINDSFGHATGDELLRTTVGAIRVHIRATDLVARLGGDEFALLLPEADLEGARTVIGRIRSGIQKEMDTRGWPVTMSVGSLTCLDPRPDVDELVRKADELMYQSKLKGKNQVSFIALQTREENGAVVKNATGA
jgi:diguanylate cyclase (GGDEF)-like protein